MIAHSHMPILPPKTPQVAAESGHGENRLLAKPGYSFGFFSAPPAISAHSAVQPFVFPLRPSRTLRWIAFSWLRLRLRGEFLLLISCTA
jgi:hypothetical protein